MILFSEFLKKNHPKVIGSKSVFKEPLIQEWLRELKGFYWLESLNLLNIYSDLFSAFKQNLESSMDAFITKHPSEELRSPAEFTHLLDQQAMYLRDSFYFMVKLYTKRNPHAFPSFHFEASENGVSVEGYLCKQKQRILIGSCHGGLGKDSTDDSLQKKIVANIKPFCAGNHEHFETVRERTRKSKYHGEDAWMVEFAPQLINKLKNITQKLFIKKELIDLYDSIWLRNFVQYPRIEFVLNTAPCEHCQNLFKNLRLMLNKEGLYIPIIIYSIYPYNNHETEMSQVNVLSFSGEFIQTDMFMDTKYNKTERPVKSISAFANLENALIFDKKVYQLLSELNIMIGDSIPQQFFSGLHHYLMSLDLSKPDLGLIKAFLDHFPVSLRNKAPKEYQECLDYVQSNSPSIFNSIFTQENINKFFKHILPKKPEDNLDNDIHESDTESEWDSISTSSDDFEHEDMDILLSFFMIFSYANPEETQKNISLNLIMAVLIYTILKKIKNDNPPESEPPMFNP